MSDTPPNQHDNDAPQNGSKAYKVGYGKPPKEWQRKKGECPKPRGPAKARRGGTLP